MDRNIDEARSGPSSATSVDARRPGFPSFAHARLRYLLVAPALLVALVASLLAFTPSAAQAAVRVPPKAQGLWDGGDNWEICHGSRYRRDILDYGIGDIQRRLRTKARMAAYIRQVNACTDRRARVYIRPMHEINGAWFPWATRSAAQYRRDFCQLKRFWKASSTKRQWSKVRWVEGLNHGTPPKRGWVGSYHAKCADVIGVSIFLRKEYSWNYFDRASSIGARSWEQFARARTCGSMHQKPRRRERTYRCPIAAAEWGVEDGWKDGWRNDVVGYRTLLGQMSRWTYQAPLCGQGTPWINPSTGRTC